MGALQNSAVGDVLTIQINGAPARVCLLHKGNPDPDIYDASCNGAWLWLMDGYEEIQWNTTRSNIYSTSTYINHLKDDLAGIFDPSIWEIIQTVKIPYRSGGGLNGTDETGANGFECKLFPLCGLELGYTSASSPYFPQVGSVLDYFSGTSPDTDAKRIVKFNGSPVNWWSRDPATNSDLTVFTTSTAGGNSPGYTDSSFVSAFAFILPLNTYVDENGEIVSDQPVPSPTITSPQDVVWGIPATATCTTVEDPNGGTVSYSWGLSYDGTSWQTLSGSSNSCTYSAFGDHYLRVQAVSTTGDSSDYAQSALVQVSSWGPQIIYGRGIGKIREESIVVNVNESFTLEYSNRSDNCTNTDPIVVTVPADLGDVGFEAYFFQSGAGSVTFAPAETVTINSVGGSLVIGEQYGLAALKLVSENTWNLQGLLG